MRKDINYFINNTPPDWAINVAASIDTPQCRAVTKKTNTYYIEVAFQIEYGNRKVIIWGEKVVVANDKSCINVDDNECNIDLRPEKINQLLTPEQEEQDQKELAVKLKAQTSSLTPDEIEMEKLQIKAARQTRGYARVVAPGADVKGKITGGLSAMFEYEIKPRESYKEKTIPTVSPINTTTPKTVIGEKINISTGSSSSSTSSSNTIITPVLRIGGMFGQPTCIVKPGEVIGEHEVIQNVKVGTKINIFTSNTQNENNKKTENTTKLKGPGQS